MYRDSANLIFANDGHVYSDVIIDVRDQFRRIQHSYVSHQPDHEPSDSFHLAGSVISSRTCVWVLPCMRKASR